MSKISEFALVSKDAKIGRNVEIGPFCVVEGGAEIGDNTILKSNVFVSSHAKIGENNVFYPFCSIGTEPQDLKFKGEDSFVIIGDNNVFRENTTINRGTAEGNLKTIVGSNGFYMAYSHIAHDCIVGNNVIFANGATLAGHVEVGDFAIVGAFVGVHQFCKVGKYSFIGGYSVITRDTLPFLKTVGSRNSAKTYGVNSIGLKRLGFNEKRIDKIKSIYKILIRSKKRLAEAISEIEETFVKDEDVSLILNFVKNSKRGFIR